MSSPSFPLILYISSLHKSLAHRDRIQKNASNLFKLAAGILTSAKISLSSHISISISIWLWDSQLRVVFHCVALSGWLAITNTPFHLVFQHSCPFYVHYFDFILITDFYLLGGETLWTTDKLNYVYVDFSIL